MAGHYLTFLFDLEKLEKVPGSESRAPDPRQPEGDQWKVIRDGGKVTLIAQVDGQTAVIGDARWRAGMLEARTPPLKDVQWDMVEAILQVHADPGAAARPRAEPAAKPRAELDQLGAKLGENVDRGLSSSRFKLARIALIATPLVVTGVLLVWWGLSRRTGTATPGGSVAKVEPPAAVVTAARATAPSEPPPAPISPEVQVARAERFEDAIALAKPAMANSRDELSAGAALLAHYTKLRWADVDVPAETSIGHVQKDPDVERGKRMCAEGVIERIERRDLGPRKIYVGQLRAAEDDQVMFVALGTTGELIKRTRAKFCGAVIGTAGDAVSLVGMFDLPENRAPIVEQ